MPSFEAPSVPERVPVGPWLIACDRCGRHSEFGATKEIMPAVAAQFGWSYQKIEKYWPHPEGGLMLEDCETYCPECRGKV